MIYFYECEDSNIANYADDTTTYACRENIRAVISELQSFAFKLFMKANPEKSHILLSNKKTEKVTINDAALTSGVEEKLLGFVLDSGLKSEKHVTGIYNKASEKIHVLSRITSYMPLKKRRLLMKMFVESVCQSRRLNNKIINLHKKTRKIVYSNYKSTF